MLNVEYTKNLIIVQLLDLKQFEIVSKTYFTNSQHLFRTGKHRKNRSVRIKCRHNST